MTRLRTRIAQAREEQRGILVGFLPSGFPDPEGFAEAVGAAFEAGLDALEVSMPGPAPELDGPLIQRAALQASERTKTVDEALRLAAASRRHPGDTIIGLAYARTLDEITPEGFLEALSAADIDAFLLPQTPVADQLALGARARELGIDAVVFLHLQEDLELIASGILPDPIIYLQSADLQTGGAFNPEKARERLGELAEAMDGKPYVVLVGFGVRGYAEAIVVMSAGADGAIVGTRLVSAAESGAEETTTVIDDISPALVRHAEVER